jgi:small-conductance mechanosensitive channel
MLARADLHRSIGPILTSALLLAWGMVSIAAQTPARSDASYAAIVASSTPGEPAALVVHNRRITTFRATVLARPASERAVAVAHLLDSLVTSGRIGPVTSRPVDGAFVVSVAGQDVFGILPLDVDHLISETAEHKTAEAVANLQVALDEATEFRSPGRILRAAAMAAGATLLAMALIWTIARFRRGLSTGVQAKAERRLERLAAGDSELVRVSRAADVLKHVVTLASVVAVVLVAYAWLTFVLRRFPYTRPWGESLRSFLLDRVTTLALRFVHTLPDLFTVLLIFLAIRFVARLLRAVFEAAEAGRISMPYVYPETAGTTQRLVAALLWLLGLVAAYPYLPGSQSDAFKGISVFVGLVVSLGSSGIVNQLMSGLTLTYSRALRLGDFVRVGDVEGTVTHLGGLSTKIKSPRGEELTMPNALVVSCVTTNFSRLADEGVYVPTKITIGYDTPWRQVKALLLLAAERTAGVRAQPTPVVRQTALEDFYVAYTLLVSLERPHQRGPVLDALHANIQDAFNEYGVQIMSPNYEADPEGRKVVPKNQWYAAPARPASEAPERLGG